MENKFTEFNQRFHGLLKAAEMPSGQEEIARGYCGFPIEHDYPALTPSLWNPIFRKFGRPTRAIMLVGQTDRTKEILDFLKKDEEFQGGGLGVGFKDEAVAQGALDGLHPLAERIGAANVVAKEEGKLIGYNTDGLGYVRSLQEKMAELGKDLADTEILILGAGGTASAIAFTLAGQAKKITILNRTLSKAEKLYERLTSFVDTLPESHRTEIEAGDEKEIAGAAAQANVILNTTLKGATGKFEKFAALSNTDSVVENLTVSQQVFQSLKRDTLISDVNLTKGDPITVTLAKQYNLPTLDGRPMVLYQAIEAFWLVNHSWLETKGVTKEEIEKLMRQTI